MQAAASRATSSDWMIDHAHEWDPCLDVGNVFKDNCWLGQTQTSPVEANEPCTPKKVDRDMPLAPCRVPLKFANVFSSKDYFEISQPSTKRARGCIISHDVLASLMAAKAEDDDDDDEILLPLVKSRMTMIPHRRVICKPTSRDVLFGRGGRGNHHPGNIRYREMVKSLRDVYTSSDKIRKTELSRGVLRWVRESGGRFLIQDKVTKQWYEADKKISRKKASQAFREAEKAARREESRKCALSNSEAI